MNDREIIGVIWGQKSQEQKEMEFIQELYDETPLRTEEFLEVLEDKTNAAVRMYATVCDGHVIMDPDEAAKRAKAMLAVNIMVKFLVNSYPGMDVIQEFLNQKSQ